MNEPVSVQANPSLTGKLYTGSIRSFRLTNLKQRLKQLSKYLGPAFIVSVAYIDPGNTVDRLVLKRPHKPVIYGNFALFKDINSTN